MTVTHPTTTHDLIVIGTGAAGLSAAREALHRGLSTALLESALFGGLVLNVNELDGAIQGSGAELAATWFNEVLDLGGENLEGAAQSITHDGSGLLVTSEVGIHRARAVIVATGAALRKLGVPGEAELESKGVSHCADCDGPMFSGQTVVVVGGGDSALQSAMVLSKTCAAVHLVHRSEHLRAQPHWVSAVEAAPNVTVHRNAEVSEVLGGEAVEGVRMGDEVVACSGFFAFVGLTPNSALLPPEVQRDARGAVLTAADLQTALPGVFAAGAVRAGCGGSLADAVADGQAAAQGAAGWIATARA